MGSPKVSFPTLMTLTPLLRPTRLFISEKSDIYRIQWSYTIIWQGRVIESYQIKVLWKWMCTYRQLELLLWSQNKDKKGSRRYSSWLKNLKELIFKLNTWWVAIPVMEVVSSLGIQNWMHFCHKMKNKK